MKKAFYLLVMAAIAATMVLTSLPASAKKGKGKTSQGQGKNHVASEEVVKGPAGDDTDKPSETPAGWSRGKKTGWQGGSYPPGWSKWNKKKQKRWVEDRDRACADIYGIAGSYNISTEKQKEINDAFNQAIAGGAAINESAQKLSAALRDEKSRRGLMVDTTQSVLDLLR